MKRAALFGAGQVGTMLLRLLAAEYEPLCFIDNSAVRQGGLVSGLPVLSPDDAMVLAPDCILLCVLDDERAFQMEAQLAGLGYRGELIRPWQLKVFDARAAVMRLLAEQIRSLGVEGCAAELGVYRGDFARLINAAFPDRPLLLFDTFGGFTQSDVELERSLGLSGAKTGDFSDTSVEDVRAVLPHPELADFRVGYFPDSFLGCEGLGFAFVSLDADLYAPTLSALELFWPRLSPGGCIMVHDVNGKQYPGAGKAVSEFCGRNSILPLPICDLHGSVVLSKPL